MSCYRQTFVLFICGLIAAVLPGCSTVTFYSQAIQGQAEILMKARPVAQVLNDPKVPEKVKRKLVLAQEVRRFAKTKLGLPATGRYDRYTDLQRRYVSWVVFAAPEFSVEGKTWWYPVVGSLKYRGFFSETAAKAEAANLKARGFDVDASGVEAYSTLGWFHDPVLNTFFDRTDAEFAELLFHELTHVRLFIPGDTDFNEAFATANAEAAVRRWLAAKGDRRALARYEAGLAKDREIVRLLLETREKLKTLYRTSSGGPPQLRRKKESIFSEMRERYAGIRKRWRSDSHYDRSFARPWNNARLNTVATYYDLVPAFERLLKARGGDTECFYSAVEAMRTLSKEQRLALLKGGDQPAGFHPG
jgi:predicted aminopeptidase